MENKKNNLVLTILAIATLLVAIASASFAYFTAIASTSQQIETGKLVVSSITGTVVGENIKPVLASALEEPWYSEDENVSTIQKNDDIIKINVNVNTAGTTITTKNADKVIADLDLYLTAIAGWNDLEYTNGIPSDIKWKLVDSNTGTEINSGEFNQMVTELRLTKDSSALNITSDVTSYDYTLLVYILENNKNQTDLQDLTLSAKIRAEVKQHLNT